MTHIAKVNIGFSMTLTLKNHCALQNMTSNLQKSNRFLRLKNTQGKNVCVVREVYRREYIPCNSELCLGSCNAETGLCYLDTDLAKAHSHEPCFIMPLQ